MTRATIICADVATVDLSEHAPFHGVFCDPPYGIKFMGREWDHGVPSPEVWAWILTHVVPGANIAAFGGTRTYHRLACALEDSGLEIRDSIGCWMYGTGWPKPADVGKFIDKRLGKKRVTTGPNPNARGNRAGNVTTSVGVQTAGASLTAPASPEAERFDGWHASLKPSWEPLVLARKPLDGTLADNALTHGVAGLNIDACRVGTGERPLREPAEHINESVNAFGRKHGCQATGTTTTGRWPANTVVVCGCGEELHDSDCPVGVLDAQSGTSTSDNRARVAKGRSGHEIYGVTKDRPRLGHSDSGGASRFFYCAKVSKRERRGLRHPTMKPLQLTEYFARLLLPPPGVSRTLVVPFSGVGSEVLGSLRAGWDHVVGIEQDAGFAASSVQRIRAAGFSCDSLDGSLEPERV
jgi:site-specific DNA-methyltransferase (adenine-specific)